MPFGNVVGEAVSHSQRCATDATGDPIKNVKGQHRFLVTWRDHKGATRYNAWFLDSAAAAKAVVEDPKSGLGGMLVSVVEDKV